MRRTPAWREVRVPHRDTVALVLITREEIRSTKDDDHRVREAVHRYSEKHARWHGRLKRALRPYGDNSTSVGDALRRAAADLGVDADGRGFEALAEMVMAAAEAKGGRRLGDGSVTAGPAPNPAVEGPVQT